MRLGISSYTYTWAVGVAGYEPEHPLSACGLLLQAARLGVKVVQIADNLPLDLLTARELVELEQTAQSLHISIEVGTRGIASVHLLRYLAIAQRLASPILRVVVDTPKHQPTADEIVAGLRPLETAFKSSGVTLAIENHDRLRAEDLRSIVTALGSWVGICLDTVNSFGVLQEPESVVTILGPQTVNLHIKDFTIYRASHKMGFSIEGCPAGQGRLDIPWLLCSLKMMGHDPNAILELWTPPEATLAATIIKEERWAEESVHYLRSLIPD
ncbi:MAG: sugar phosphate isomerase/epimerase family protein [Anaerolineae bacterium]